MNTTKSTPKFTIDQPVICRVKTSSTTFYDLRGIVLDIFDSQEHGYKYKVAGIKDYIGTDIKPESELRAARG